MSKNPQMAKKAWSKLAHDWAQLKPPARPSQGEIKIYDEAIKIIKKSISRPNVLLCGATPELRDLLAKHRCRVTLVDININMIRAMSELTKISDGREKFVISNWLKMPLPDGQFDIILGDHTINLIKFSEYDQELNELKRLLKPNGYIIFNIMVNFYKKVLTVAEMVKLYKKFPQKFKTLADRFYYQANILYTDPAILDKSKKIFDCYDLDKSLEKFYHRGIITKKELKRLQMGYGRWTLTAVTRQEVEYKLNKYFKIIFSKINREHPYYACYRIWFARVK